MKFKNLKNGNKQREKCLLKNIGLRFSIFDHSQFLQERMQGGNIRLFNK